jgi:hypothetical protein
MRTRHAIAVVAAVLLGFGLKLGFFPGPIAVAGVDRTKSANIDVSGHHRIQNLPVESFDDTTFVAFGDG